MIHIITRGRHESACTTDLDRPRLFDQICSLVMSRNAQADGQRDVGAGLPVTGQDRLFDGMKPQLTGVEWARSKALPRTLPVTASMYSPRMATSTVLLSLVAASKAFESGSQVTLHLYENHEPRQARAAQDIKATYYSMSFWG